MTAAAIARGWALRHLHRQTRRQRTTSRGERRKNNPKKNAGNGWGFPSTLAAVGGTHVCLRDVTVDGIAEAFAERGVTHLCGAPIVVNLAIQAMEQSKPGRRIRMMTAGAAPAAATLRRAAAAGLDVTHVYGMTETFGPAAVCEKRSTWPVADVACR